MLDFLEDNDLSQPENYAYIQTQMDVDNFMNYKIAQIFYDNVDAGGRAVKRSQNSTLTQRFCVKLMSLSCLSALQTA